MIRSIVRPRPCRPRHARRRQPGGGADRRPHAPPARRLGDADRLRLRRRHLGRAQDRRHRRPPELAARRGELPALLARRHDARLHRQLRRQHRRLRRPGAGGDAGAPHVSPDARSRPRLVSRTASACSSPPSARAAAALQPVLSRRAEGGLPEKLPVPYGEFAAFSPDAKTFAYLPQSQEFRNVEALSRRLGAGHVALRPRDEHGDERHRQRGATTRSRCGTATRSTSSPIAAPTSAPTSGRCDKRRRARGRSRTSPTST